MAASVLKCQGLGCRAVTSSLGKNGNFALTRAVKFQCLGHKRTFYACNVLFQSPPEFKKPPVISPQKLVAEESKEKITQNVVDEYSSDLEQFIPITRRSVIRYLMQQEKFLNEEEVKLFEKFALALDSAVVNKYHGLLQELKILFDPINPDKDTLATQQYNRKERLDNEFWLLQRLSLLMRRANFQELSQSAIDKALREHKSDEGVLVSVNRNNYDVLRIWALGKETPQKELSMMQKMFYKVLKKQLPIAPEHYKRTVVAVRLKRDDKLLLKAFKEVPTGSLEQLLPDGKIKMTQFDRTILSTSIGLTSFGLVANTFTQLAHINVEWMLVSTAVTGLIALKAWSAYKNRRNAYLVQLSKMLYFKNVSNNRGLLTVLIDRAEDELFKEALLAYTFLLTNRPPSAMLKVSIDQLPAELGGVPQRVLEGKIEEWCKLKTNTSISFNANTAVKLLIDLGIVGVDKEENLYVLPLDTAIRNLPLTPQSLAERLNEEDALEGFDKSLREGTDNEYVKEDETRKKYGWD